MHKPTLLILAASMTFSLAACKDEEGVVKASDGADKNPHTNAKTDIKASNQISEPQKELIEAKDGQKMTSMRGTIEWKDFEGGFYGFTAEDGSKYTFTKLAPEHRKDGLVVEVRGKVVEGMMTITQYGEVFDVTSIEVIDNSQVKSKNDHM